MSINHDDRVSLETRLHQMQQRLRDYEYLIQALQTLSVSFEVEAILEQLLDTALRLSGAQQGTLMLLEQEQDGRTLIRGGSDEDRILDHYLNMLLSGWIRRHGRALLSDNLVATFGAQQIQEKYRRITSVLSIPLRHRGEIIGVINLVSLDPSSIFSERESHLLDLLTARFGSLVEKSRRHEDLFAETSRLRREVADRYAVGGVIGRSPAMQDLFSILDRVLPTEGRILLEGESGTGKELIARIIHYHGPRRSGPFVAVDCGALPANLLESELFGYVKGAFTGAVQNKKGLFEEAHQGTLFLDEVANMPNEIQAKFLRAIQEGEIRPLGSTQVRSIDVRIISAASRSLRDQVRDGFFRPDLFYRLNVVNIVVPPLRDRKTDLPVLAHHFLRKTATTYAKKIRDFHPDTLRIMEQYDWPGNVRELENIVERMVILAPSEASQLTSDLLPTHLHPAFSKPDTTASRSGPSNLQADREQFEKERILDALRDQDWNQSAAARALGISEGTLRYKLNKWGIQRPR